MRKKIFDGFLLLVNEYIVPFHVPFWCSIPMFLFRSSIPMFLFRCSIPMFRSDVPFHSSFHSDEISMFHSDFHSIPCSVPFHVPFHFMLRSLFRSVHFHVPFQIKRVRPIHNIRNIYQSRVNLSSRVGEWAVKSLKQPLSIWANE